MSEIKYDPNKKYVWNPETEFVLKGAEFGAVLNTLRSFLSTAEAQRVLMASGTHELVESILASAVESGKVTESPEQQ